MPQATEVTYELHSLGWKALSAALPQKSDDDGGYFKDISKKGSRAEIRSVFDDVDQ